MVGAQRFWMKCFHSSTIFRFPNRVHCFASTTTTTTKLSSSSNHIWREMEDIPEVDIDEGRFKYVLIKLTNADKQTKHIVRGYAWADYHADIYEKVEPNILKDKIKCTCVGGGRIEHNPQKKTIHIFGYSQGYGLADHSISCRLVQSEYPDYKVTWANEGY